MKYVVVDLEMCKVSRALRCAEYHYGSETIQIGAVLLDDNYEIVSKFNTYVHPQYGQIDHFINKLTGINKQDITDVPEFGEALKMFLDWLPEDAVCVSWSESDEKHIRHETQAKGITDERLPGILDSWIDCQKTFGKRMGASKPYSLAEALIAADVFQEGNAHDGLTDACNTAVLFAKMMKNPEFDLHPAYKAAHEGTSQPLTVNIGELLGNITLKND